MFDGWVRNEMTQERAEALERRRNTRQAKRTAEKFPLFALDPAIAPPVVTAGDVLKQHEERLSTVQLRELLNLRNSFRANIYRRAFAEMFPGVLVRTRTFVKDRDTLAAYACDAYTTAFCRQGADGLRALESLTLAYAQDDPEAAAFARAWFVQAWQRLAERTGLFYPEEEA